MTPPGLGVALQAAPAGALAVWRTAAAQHQGARGHQCDAVAVDADGNRAAAVVVDGVGDDDQIAGIGPDVAEDLAARALRLEPAAAIAAVGDEWIGEVADTAYDAAVVVAVRQNGLTVVGWAGDAAAYWLDDAGLLHRATTPHTAAQRLLDLGEEPDSWDHHWLERSLFGGVPEQVTLPASARRLLLCSDGTDKPLARAALRNHLRAGGPAAAAAALAGGAVLAQSGPALAYADNATALVVDLVVEPAVDRAD